MTLPDPAASTATSAAVVHALRPLVHAEAAAEATTCATGAAIEPADLEQAVWLRLLERLARGGPPADTGRWVRETVRAEVRRARRTARREHPYRDAAFADPSEGPERTALDAEERRALRAAIGRLPGRCARLLAALLAPEDPTYREIAGKLGMSQGSLGPIRSRCLGCLRRMLAAEVVAPGPRGRERETTGGSGGRRHAHMGMSVIISAATAQDAEEILKLQYLCFQGEAELYGNYRIDPLVQTLDSVRAEIATQLVFVARLGDEVVGSVRGFADEDGTGRIGRLCVHPRLRGHGLGARLLRAAESGLVDERSATRFRLCTGHRSENNLRLYQRAGYAAVGNETGRDGVRMVLLEKDVTAPAYVASA